MFSRTDRADSVRLPGRRGKNSRQKKSLPPPGGGPGKKSRNKGGGNDKQKKRLCRHDFLLRYNAQVAGLLPFAGSRKDTPFLKKGRDQTFLLSPLLLFFVKGEVEVWTVAAPAAGLGRDFSPSFSWRFGDGARFSSFISPLISGPFFPFSDPSPPPPPPIPPSEF